jgi:hypothetical protein
VDRKRLLRLLSLVALAGGLAAALPLAQRWPKEQTIHYVLGDAAPRVEELDARWREGAPGAARGAGATDDDVSREATFRYAQGQAPRVVTHLPELPDGDYTVEIDLVAGNARSTVSRQVRLAGGATSIDLAGAVPR